MTRAISLRDVMVGDLLIFFEHQLDPAANHMAAFVRKDPADKASFFAHWRKIMLDETVTIQTIIYDGQVAGHVLCYEQQGELEISYWIGEEYWRKGIATQALSKFLELQRRRPLFARVAKDHVASIRVLEKCGFTIIGEDKGFSNARGREIEEYFFQLGDTV